VEVFDGINSKFEEKYDFILILEIERTKLKNL
jgi:hypothetical protein